MQYSLLYIRHRALRKMKLAGGQNKKGLLQNSSLKKYCTKPGTFSGPKRLKKGSGFLILRYFFVQVAIAFLFCNSPSRKVLENYLVFFVEALTVTSRHL